MLEAKCHCGNIVLSTTELPESVTSCNCSICHSLGALWAYYNLPDVGIKNSNPADSIYEWGEKTMSFHRCENCGCTTHYTRTEDDGNRLVAINTRMVSPAQMESISIRYFDGAVSWKYIEE